MFYFPLSTHLLLYLLWLWGTACIIIKLLFNTTFGILRHIVMITLYHLLIHDKNEYAAIIEDVYSVTITSVLTNNSLVLTCTQIWQIMYLFWHVQLSCWLSITCRLCMYVYIACWRQGCGKQAEGCGGYITQYSSELRGMSLSWCEWWYLCYPTHFISQSLSGCGSPEAELNSLSSKSLA